MSSGLLLRQEKWSDVLLLIILRKKEVLILFFMFPAECSIL